jgi:hypothetical protein
MLFGTICKKNFFWPNTKKSSQKKGSMHPKILILGFARHGKDTAAEFLRDDFGLSFCSSSLFCAEKIVRPALAAQGIFYSDVQSCFEDRGKHREKWFEAIKNFNTNDHARLGRALFEQYDIYVGLRNVQEVEALKKEKRIDLTLWIDSSDRGIPKEDMSSCTVSPLDADIVVKNDGGLEDLRMRLRSICEIRFPDLRKLY